MTPFRGSRKAIEKMPVESEPWRTGVSKTCQVRPRSAEWKTRAARPPLANQMLGSGAALSGAEAPSLFWPPPAGLEVVPFALALESKLEFRELRIARQVLLEANAASPSCAGGS